MKKIFLFFFFEVLLLFAGHKAIAQPLVLRNVFTGSIVTNATLSYSAVTAPNTNSFGYYYANQSPDTLMVMTICRKQLAGAGSSSYFMDCYSVYTQSNFTYTYTLLPGDSCFLMSDFTWDGTAGVSLFRYTIYNMTNTADSAFVLLKYNDVSGTGQANDRTPETFLSEARPNPASGDVRFSYRIPSGQQARMIVRDINGREIFASELPAEKNVAELNVSSWPSGIYLISITGEAGISETRRMIVAQ